MYNTKFSLFYIKGIPKYATIANSNCSSTNSSTDRLFIDLRCYMMNEYEVYIEDINPCGGSKYAKKEIIEVEAASPEAYVKANGRFPILEITTNASRDVVITTGDGKGNILRYTFFE